MSDKQEEETKTLVPSGGPDRDQMAGDYLPEGDDWLAKTALDINDPHAVAALRQFSVMFPEVAGGESDELQSMIDEFVDDFMKGRTSVAAQSREEYKDIIMSMFGGNPDDKTRGERFAELLGASENEE